MPIERVLYNGNVITLADEIPRASAIAIERGRIVAVGGDDEVLSLATTDAIREDLAGRTVIPGLIDAHLHWQWTSSAMHAVDVFEVPSKAVALERVAERVAETPPGEWIRGHGWAQDLWPDKAFPTAADLDVIAPHNPVYLIGKSAHVAWVNSAALRLSGITADTPNPHGGDLVRDTSGQPTGILLEAPAMNLVQGIIPKLTPDQIADQMLVGQAKAHQQGLTAIHDLDDPDALAAFQILRERGKLSLRVNKYINKPYFEAALESGLRAGFGDDWIRIGGLKMFADGALGPRTAWMLDPYEGEPDNLGITVTEPAEMLDFAIRANLAGLPTAIHAIGDRAVREVLDIFEQVRATEAEHGIPREARRHRVEHVQIIHPDDVARLAELDIIASMQPLHATSDATTADRYWGDRAALSYNARAQLDAGAVLAFGSDSPIEPFDPFAGLHAAVTRQRPDGSLGEGWRTDACLTVDEALRAYTTGAAYAAGLEDRQGRLKPGYYADLVVLDADPYEIDPTQLHALTVIGTMVDGEWRYGGV
ncbi:MAG: amidohydrolase [Chloroflexota bacterium]